jgi:uncharacterized protein DUF4136
MNSTRNRAHARWLLTLIAAAGPLVNRSDAAKVRVELQPGADFARYKTYQWLPPKVLTNTGVVENHPVLGPAMKDAINRQLLAHGLTEVAEGGDIEVSALALTASIPQLEAVVFGGPNMMYATPIATMGRYNREGTLIVNLIDARTKKSAWVGMVKESLDKKEGAGQKKLPSAAAKMFKKYPSPK